MINALQTGWLMQPPPSPQALFTGAQQRLFVARGVNLQSTADQLLTKVFHGTKYMIQSIVASGRSGGATVACSGGIYTGAAKSGSVFVAAGQSWLGISASAKLVSATLAALLGTDEQTATPLYFSLTTGSTAAATADIFIIGNVTD